MSIRAKFLVALLTAVLLPTVFAALLGYTTSVRAARGLATEQRQTLLEEAEGVLLAVMEKNVGLFEQESVVYVAARQTQNLEARRRLEAEAPATGGRLPVAEFREGGRAPGLAPSDDHLVVNPDGSESPALVSYDAVAVYLAPDGDADDADRLAGMSEYLRAFGPAARRAAYWQFVTLDSGVHAVYPGHGLLPDGYDARQGALYQRTRPNIGRGFGSPPSVDPATGQTLIGMVGPVTDSEGAIIGITGVLSRVDAVLDGLRFGAQWGEQAENYFAVVAPDNAGERHIYIIAKRSYAHADQGESGFVGLETFETDDPADAGAVMEAFLGAGSGARLVTVDGRDMLCTYAGFRRDAIGLITLVPVESIGAIADQGAARIQARARTQLIGVLLGLGAFAAGMGLAAFLGARAITGPIAALVGAVRRVSAGDLEVRTEVNSRDEVGELAAAFNLMVPRLRDHLRIRDSLELAQQVQRRLLPAAPPAVPGFDIAARSIYCDETGGDYFDFLEFDQPEAGSLAVAVGDVTGHGVAAALLMATARALLRMRATLPGQLAEHIADINRQLAADAETGRFMTLFLLVLSPDRRTARWVGAGHDPVLVYDPQADEFDELQGVDIPLGIEPAWAFNECSSDRLAPGRVLVLGTDGIWEARDADDRQYGKDRLRACIRAHAARGETADQIAGAVVEEVRAFRGERAQLDDVTLVVVRLVSAARAGTGLVTAGRSPPGR